MSHSGIGLWRDEYHRYWAHYPPEPPVGPLFGVTSPLKLQDVLIGGDLAAWGGRIAARHVVEHWDDPLPRDAISDALKAVSAARDIGTVAHDAIARILTRQPVTPTPETSGYVYAFSSFLAAERPEFIAVEAMVANLKYGYAGAFDFAAWLRGRIALVDVKTGKFKRSHRLQLAGYSAAEFIGAEGDPEKHPLPRFRDFYILLLKPDGQYELVQLDVTAADRRHFLTLVRTYHQLRAWDDAAREEEAA